ncbi:MAG: Uma2 family endonuclease [Saprospiraceae bacterium]|nr:Uma2 family endonuclease [Saprospiraceae bacterium]
MAVVAKKMTYQEFRQLEFDENDPFLYELINGELVKKSAPNPEHQEISGLLYNKIFTHIVEKKLGKILYAPIDVFLDEHNVPQPDLVFVRQERLDIIDKKEGILGRPDMVIEIMSPNSVKRDRFDKKDLYERFAVPEYWIVDPQNMTIEIYKLQNNRYELIAFAAQSGIVRSEALGGWELEINQLFS